MNERKGFVFYRSFYEAIKGLPPADRDKIFMTICEYALNDTEPSEDGFVGAIFALIKPQIDANNQRYENGKKGGRPKTSAEPADNRNKTEVKPKDKDKDKVKDKDITSIVQYLNDKTGKSFRANTAATRKHIGARLGEGYTLADFKAVIDKKAEEWLGTDMEKYLRPETLFASKFEGYLQEPRSLEAMQQEKKQAEREQALSKLRAEKAWIERELKALEEKPHDVNVIRRKRQLSDDLEQVNAKLLNGGIR